MGGGTRRTVAVACLLVAAALLPVAAAADLGDGLDENGTGDPTDTPDASLASGETTPTPTPTPTPTDGTPTPDASLAGTVTETGDALDATTDESVGTATNTTDETVENTTNATEDTAGTATNTTDETIENTTNTTDETIENTTNTTDQTVETVGDTTTDALNATTDGNVTGAVATVGESTTNAVASLGEGATGTVERVARSVDRLTVDGATTKGSDPETSDGDDVPTRLDAGSGDGGDASRAAVAAGTSGTASKVERSVGTGDGGQRFPTGNGGASAAAGIGAIVAGAFVGGGGTTTLRSTARAAFDALDRAVRTLVPLRYSRYDDSDPLEHEDRRAIYEHVKDEPGAYLSETSDAVGVPLSTVRHHVRVLEREDLIENTKLRGRRRLFPAHADGQELVAALANGATADVLAALARLGSCSASELADELDRSVSTVSHHLSRLEADDLVTREREGRTTVNRLSPDVADALGEGGEADAGEEPIPARAD